MVEISKDFCDKVRVEELGLSALRISLGEAIVKRDADDFASGQAWSGLNFRERYLFAWFGGDKDKRARYRALQQVLDTSVCAVQQLLDRIKKQDKTIWNMIHQWLLDNDQAYQLLSEHHDKLSDVVDVASDCVREINEARRAVSNAQSMEFMDMMSKNKGISVMSSAATATATSEMLGAKNSTRYLNEALQAYGEYMGTIDFKSIDLLAIEGVDLYFDFVFDAGFDITSFFSLGQLGHAAGGLSRAEDQAERVLSILEKKAKKSEATLIEYRDAVRKKING